MSRGTRATWAEPTLVAALVALFWALRVVRPAQVPSPESFDLRVYFYPTYDAFYGFLARGELLRWNPYQLCGLPWLGTSAGGYFYPPHLLYLILPTHVAMAASSLLHLVLGALFMLVFARRLDLAASAGVLAAVLFTCRGALTYWVRWPYHLEPGAWLPLGCVAVLTLARGRPLPGAVLLATVTGMSWLAGGPQMTVFSVYARAALLLVVLPNAQRRSATVMGFAAALALGTAAGALQLVPSAELAATAERASRQLDWARMFPLGDPGLYIFWSWIGGGGQAAFAVVALALLPAALFARARAVAAWALVVGVLALGFAVGGATPLFRLYLMLPVLGWFRGPYRLVVLAGFCFALLAGLALDALVQRRAAGAGAAPSRVSATLAGLLAVPAALRGLAATAATAATTAVVLASRVRAPVVGTIVTLLVVIELFLAPPKRSLLPYGAASAAAYRTHDEAYEALAREQGAERVWIVRPPVVPSDLAPRLATRHRVRLVDDYEGVALQRQADYLTYLAEGQSRSARPGASFTGAVPPPPAKGTWGPAPRRHLLDLAAVGLIVTPTGAVTSTPGVQELIAAGALVPLPSPDPTLAVWRNPHAAPRAYVAYRTATAPPETDVLLARLADPAFDPLGLAYVEGDAGIPPPASVPRGHAATITRDEPHVIEVEATLAAPGLVVLADTFHPAWSASVDGAPAAIFPTNHLFRGVPVPAGTHRVRFEYPPTRLLGAAAVSIVAWLAIGFLALHRGHR
jgi:hypothetical protein